MEIWEAATHRVPIVLFPVSGMAFELDEAAALLSDLAEHMEAHNPYCLPEVMGCSGPSASAFSARAS